MGLFKGLIVGLPVVALQVFGRVLAGLFGLAAVGVVAAVRAGGAARARRAHGAVVGASGVPAVGWYPDAWQSGWWRYWDGVCWSQSVPPQGPAETKVEHGEVRGETVARQVAAAFADYRGPAAGLRAGFAWG
ncbi:hypothetical protein [Pseudoclavibacter sp. CFCC 13611]|uniref:hypothetical protein n=1 Tax=Pseudoclavibacter sp. CFCC 13611 TaxID=2615178 RepID=UPI001300E72E|nr:hypothetical protein [Pseudoclavibacter sp. CFCC 13611]KAB1662766.1 hypothetical protein F8O08_09345 [Pseudoclavibacter sp. CFCC 13611]